VVQGNVVTVENPLKHYWRLYNDRSYGIKRDTE
jgi:hypothetical protein